MPGVKLQCSQNTRIYASEPTETTMDEARSEAVHTSISSRYYIKRCP